MRVDVALVAEGRLLNAKLVGQVLQLAPAVGLAGEAVEGVPDEYHLDDGLAGGQDPGAVGRDDHPLGERGRAGGEKFGVLLGLDEADAACAAWRQCRMIAERRDVDAVGPGRLEDRGPGFRRDRLPVYHGGDHVFHHGSVSFFRYSRYRAARAHIEKPQESQSAHNPLSAPISFLRAEARGRLEKKEKKPARTPTRKDDDPRRLSRGLLVLLSKHGRHARFRGYPCDRSPWGVCPLGDAARRFIIWGQSNAPRR